MEVTVWSAVVGGMARGTHVSFSPKSQHFGTDYADLSAWGDEGCEVEIDQGP